jgi:hypothetical protein
VAFKGLVWDLAAGVRCKTFAYLSEHFFSSAEVLEKYAALLSPALSMGKRAKQKIVLSLLL